MSTALPLDLPAADNNLDTDARDARNPARSADAIDYAPEGRHVERASLLHDDNDDDGRLTNRSTSDSRLIHENGGRYNDPEAPLEYSFQDRETPRSFLLLCIIVPAIIGLALFTNYKHPFSLVWKHLSGGAGPKQTVAPTVLISIDGFRHDYLERKDSNGRWLAPNLRALANRGVRAMPGMQPVMPTKTFPNHWSLVTGLYPESHEIVGNTMYSTETKQWFHVSTKDPTWWGGEPIWKTLRRTPRLIRHANGDVGPVVQGNQSDGGTANYTTATVFWVGSDVDTMLPDAFWHYNKSITYEQRVDRVIELLSGKATDLGVGRPAQFVTLYFQLVDTMGHMHGPNSAEVNNEIVEVDKSIGELVQKLNRSIPVPVNLIVVSDHGMAEVSTERVVDLKNDIPEGTVQDVEQSPIGYWLTVGDSDSQDDSDKRLFDLMQASFKRQNRSATAYRKEDLPERWHLRRAKYVTEVVSMAKIGYVVTYPHQQILRTLADSNSDAVVVPHMQRVPSHRQGAPIISGNHGFDNIEPDMQAMFIASGPAFKSGVEVKGFRNIDVYALLCEMFSATPAPHNGSVQISRRSILARPASRR